MTVHFVIPGRPVAMKRHRATLRGNHIHMYDPEAKVRKTLGLSLKQYFPQPFEGPLKLEVVYFYSTKDKKKWGQYKITRGDLDNNLKQSADSMAGVAFIDDAQICSIIAQKKWHHVDETHVWITPL